MSDSIRDEVKGQVVARCGGRAWVFRNDPILKQLTGLSQRVLANLDSRGEGIPGRFYIGKRVAYPAEQLARWVADRARPAEAKPRRAR